MALYNPYDSVDSYYNPYENTQQPTGQGIGNVIFSAAKNMAVFGLLNIAGRAATKYLSGAAATAIKNYGKGSLGQTARRTGATSLGQIFGATSAGKDLRAIYSQVSRPFRTALNAKDSYVAQVARTTQSPSAAKLASFKSSFKDMRTFAGSVGRMWKNTVLTGAGVAYAIDSFAGVTRDYGIEQKSWYDVPGQIGNFGKWLAMDSIFSMGFGAATKIAGLAGAKAVSSAANTFRGPLGRSIGNSMSRVFPGIPIGINNQNIFKQSIQERPHSNQQMGFVSKVINNGLAFGRTVPEAMRTLNQIVSDKATLVKQAWSEAPGKPLRAVRKLSESHPIRGALEQIKDIWARSRDNRKMVSPVEHAGLLALQFTDDLANKSVANKGVVQSSHASLDLITDQLAQVNEASRNRRVLADEIFPEMDRLKNKDVVNRNWIKEKLGQLRSTYGQDEATRFMRTVLNMRSGTHLYRPRGSTYKGGGVDLGFADPLYLARKVTGSVLSKPFKVPFTKFETSFSDILQLQSLFGKEPSFDFFKGRQDFAIGKNAKGLNFDLDHGKVVSTTDIDRDSWFTAYINGHFSTIGPGGINTVDTGYKLLATPPSSSFRQAEKYRVEKLMEARGDTVRRANPPSKLDGNKHLGYFIDAAGLELPGSVRKLYNRAIGAISGKNHIYKDAAGTAFSLQPNDWYRTGDSILAVQQALGQELSQVMKHKEFGLIMGRTSRSSHFGDAFDSLVSNREIRQRLSDLELDKSGNWVEWLNKRGIAEEVSQIKADPTTAERHFVTKRQGNRPAMTAYDKVRVALFEDAVITRFGSGDGMEHPLADAIPTLLERGVIDQKQAKKLELWGKLTALTGTGMYDNHQANSTVTELGQSLLKKANERNWNLEKNIVNYVSDSDLRNTSLRDLTDLSRFLDHNYFKNTTAYASIEKHPLGFTKAYIQNTFENVTNMLHDTVFPFRKDPAQRFSVRGNMGYLFGGIGKLAATGFAYKVLDTFAAANPLFDDTAFEDGLTGFMADNVARLRLGQSRVFDALGLTGVAKHLNGLLPGFVTSAPGAIIGSVVSRTIGGGPIEMMKGFAFGAIGNRLLAPYLPDFTKSYSELEAEYQGKVEVPIMKAPTWLLGSTPYEGSKVMGYQPNWYARTKSRWKETDTLYGSSLRKLLHEPLPFLGIAPGDFIDPYYMERKHFFSRPYPETGEWGKEIPLVGPLIAGTLGRIFKPKKTMHQEFLTGPEDLTEESTYPFAIQPPTVQEGRGMMYHTMGLRKMGGRSSLMGTYVYGGDSKMWAHAAGEDFLNNVQQFAGLPGFIAGTAKDKLVGTPLVMPTLETAGRMASMSRSFYDMNLGGMGVFTEPVRRVIQKPEYKKYGINPIPNMMPNWLPQEFLSGDPYAKIMKGELRLPGEAYQVTHKVKRTMPARASMIGAPEEHMMQYFTGLLPPLLKEEYDILETGTTMHEKIQDHLAAEGLLIQAEALVYDIKNDISGHVDAIIRDGLGAGGRRALEIKSINQAAFEKLDAPKYQHVGQLNFYLKQLKMQEGTILYISRDNPSQVKTFNVKFSQNRWQKDLRKLQKVRQVTADLLGEELNDRFGYSYSWVDRLNILSDVAPTSREYKEAKLLVEKQMRLGILDEGDIQKYRTALSHRQTRLRKYELYPNRFKGKVLSPDTQKNIQSINEDIKAAAEYSLPERIVGSIWERFTNANTFLTNKLFAFKDPLEHYKMLQLYGKEYKPWDEPYGSFVETTMRGMASQTDLVGGSYKWALPLYVVGGNVGALAGSIFGAAYGTVHGLVRGATDTAFIPEIIKDRRDIETFFDQAKYERNRRMSELSEGLTKEEYLKAMNSTMTAFNENGEDVANLFRGTAYMEKPYIEPWLNTRNQRERQEILKYIPKELGQALKRQWGRIDTQEDNKVYDASSSADLASGSKRPAFNRSILDPSVNLEDIKLKTVEEAGYNAHEFGLGWNQQMYRLSDDYNSIQGANVYESPPTNAPNLNPGQVRQAIMEVLRSKGLQGSAQVYINNGSNDLNSINITLRKDRALTISKALDYRNQFYA